MAETNILRKRLILNQPKSGDVSQYTFTAEETDFDYENSTSLPKNNDKFQNKDLNITTIGSALNEKIMERNIKSEGVSFIRIDKCFVEFVGTPSPLKDVRVKMWMMSDKFISDYSQALNLSDVFSSTDLNTLVNVKDLEDRVFEYEAGRLGNGEDLGNLSFVEGVNILSNLSGSIDDVQQSDFTNKTIEYDPEVMLLRISTTSVEEGRNLNTSVFDETAFNPIYLIFELTAHGDQPSDDRDSRWQSFKIDNLELFEERDGVIVGRQKTFTFDEMFNSDDDHNESGNGISDSALKVTDLQVTINTLNQLPNNWGDSSDEKLYRDYFYTTKPAIEFNPLFYQGSADRITFLKISPENQLDNVEPPGPDYNVGFELFPDYFPKQHVGILDTNTNKLVNDVYLDEYRDDMSEQIIEIGSAPARVSFDFEMVSGSNASMTRLLPATSGHGLDIAEDYYYFVINWDDKDNEIKSLEEWLKIRPTTYRELLELQNNNLYSVVRHTQTTSNYDTYTKNTYGKRLSNTYNTPGIKTIKTIMFSYHEPSNQIGRWKLLTSRFYLDIPLNQYPDFGTVGGADYTTLPWPYTAAIIGGVSDNSKYKRSVQDTLSGGKIGNTDIIDERFLLNDLENDETGKNIEKLDLEQVRYFDTSYDLNTLLNLTFPQEQVGKPDYITDDAFLQILPGYKGGGVITNDAPMSLEELSWIPVGQSNPAFGESGYLLSVYTYEELQNLWDYFILNPQYQSEGHPILNQMSAIYGPPDFGMGYSDLVTTNWIFESEEFNDFVMFGNLSGETPLFVNDMAISMYVLKTGLYPVINYNLSATDVNQWNAFGRPDIANFVLDVIGGNLQLTPSSENEEGQLLVDPTEGGIDEAGNGTGEFYFQGGVPGGSGGGIDEGGSDDPIDDEDDGANNIPMPIPWLELNEPSNQTFVGGFQTGDVLAIRWNELNDRTLHDYNPGNYGAPYTPEAYYHYQTNQFPSSWNTVSIYLDKKNNDGSYGGNQVNTYITQDGDVFIGSFGYQSYTTGGSSANPIGEVQYTIPSVNAYEVSNTYRVRIMVEGPGNDGEDYTIKKSMIGSLGITFLQEGGSIPAVGTRPKNTFENPFYDIITSDLPHPYDSKNADGSLYWNGSSITSSFSKESSVGQIFISENQDLNLKQSCKFEINTGNLTDNSIYDSSGNSNKGVLIGDYKVKKTRKGEPMRRDSFVKVPKKTNNKNGAL